MYLNFQRKYVDILALGVHFGIPQTRKCNDSEKTYDQHYQYFAGEFLSKEELRLIYCLEFLLVFLWHRLQLLSYHLHLFIEFGLIISKRAEKVIFSDKEIEKFDELAVKWNSGSISMEKLILELRGGDLEGWVAKFGITMAIITVLNNVGAFQVPPGAIPPPHHAWMSKGPPHVGGYGSSNSRASLGLANTNDGFNELSQTEIIRFLIFR